MDSLLVGSECNNEDSDVEVLGMKVGGGSSLFEDSDAAQEDYDAASSGAEESAGAVAAGDVEQIDSESKEEDDYDFFSFPWVESLVARTRSIYADEKTISAFVDSRDVVDGNLPGNVECSWMMEDDRVYSRVSSPECRPFVLMKRQRLANAEKDKVGVSSSTFAPELPLLSPAQTVAPSSSVPAPWKRSRTEKALVPVTGQAYADKGGTPGEGLVDIFQGFTVSSVDIRSLWDHRFDVGSIIDKHLTLRNDVKRLEKKGDRSAHVMLQVFGAQMAFLGRYLELKSKNEKTTHSDLGDKVAILETKLQGYEEMKTKVAGLEGKVALLGQENTKLKEDKNTAEKSLTDMTVERDSLKIGLNEEKLKVKAAEEKYTVDFQQLNSDAAQSYGLGFEQALIQVKHFNPMADVSKCDPLKELVNGALVDLGDGEEEPVSVGVHNEEEVVDSQGGEINKPAEDSDKVGNEEQGDAPLQSCVQRENEDICMKASLPVEDRPINEKRLVLAEYFLVVDVSC
ncbi:hypothetical protein SESBI_04182 [Sesbania bispinosa]|nr:hypothetical protein SESBI_04182 [Sesbania bispinosa]